MSFELFGYNGVLEVDQLLLEKLIGSYTYDRYLVEEGGHISDRDFIAVASEFDGGSFHVYLEIARPSVLIQTSDGSNGVTVRIPFADVGMFVVREGTVQRISLPSGSLPRMSLSISDVVIQKTPAGLTIDVSEVTGADVAFAIATVERGPTDVGGTARLFPTTDETIDALIGSLASGPPPITARELRELLAERLRDGVLRLDPIPVSAAGSLSELAQWDLLLFANGPVAGADLLLYEDEEHGRGRLSNAGVIIPAAPESPAYGWSATLSADVLSRSIEAALDHAPYWVQRDTINTADNPYGYLVPPSADDASYDLPYGAGKVTVRAPDENEMVAIEFAAGSFKPNSRAHVTNLDTESSVYFVADTNGAASASIVATLSHRIALTVDAVSVDGETSLVLWRPRIELREGELYVEFHYLYEIPDWCDLEGDGSMRIRVSADRSKPFNLELELIDADASVSWWVYLGAWLTSDLLGFSVLGPILVGLIPDAANALAPELIGDNASSLSDQLAAQLRAPSIRNLAFMLDQIDIHPDGIQLSGRADCGVWLGSGRLVVDTSRSGATIRSTSPGPVTLSFSWTPGSAPISMTTTGRCYTVAGGDPAASFWNATYDDIRPSRLARDPITMSTQPVMAWVELYNGHAKVLFEPGTGASSSTVRITWVAYRQRLHRSVQLIDNTEAIRVGESRTPLVDIDLSRYEGSIDLERKKAFFSAETLPDETWRWDGEVVTEAGLSVPGGTVTLDPTQRRLLVDIDQVGFLDDNLVTPSAPSPVHTVEFRGVDVFGHVLTSRLEITLPARTTRFKRIRFDRQLADPLDDPAPFMDLFVRLSSRFGQDTAEGLVRTLGEAVTSGSAVLDATTALRLAAVLSRGL